MDTIIFGNGNLGRAIAAAMAARGDAVPRIVGRPADGRHAPDGLTGADVAFDATRPDAVIGDVAAALDAGCRRFVIATTGWEADRDIVAAVLRERDAAAVVAPNFSLGVAVYLRLIETAGQSIARLSPAAPFDPFVMEWHRSGKVDRPSGTAREIVRRLAATTEPGTDPAEIEVAVVRAGSSPGMHLVGFDAPGETIELRHTARDRTAFAAGALAAADWLRVADRLPGIHPFDEVVDDLLGVHDKPMAVTTR